MAGHMGTQQATVQSLRVVRADAEKGVLLVRGSVPGNNGVLVKIRKSTRGRAGR
jgi:large subunit ribosomal protein L3